MASTDPESSQAAEPPAPEPREAPPEDALVRRFLGFLEGEKRYSAHTVRNYRQALQAFFAALRESGRWSGEVRSIPPLLVRSYLIEAQRAGDWARYGEQLRRLGEILEQMGAQGGAGMPATEP